MNSLPPADADADADAMRALRHDLRNHLSTIRNAAFYLERRMRQTDVWDSDPRVPTFFALIESELEAAADCITARATVEHLCGTGES